MAVHPCALWLTDQELPERFAGQGLMIDRLQKLRDGRPVRLARVELSGLLEDDRPFKVPAVEVRFGDTGGGPVDAYVAIGASPIPSGVQFDMLVGLLGEDAMARAA